MEHNDDEYTFVGLLLSQGHPKYINGHTSKSTLWFVCKFWHMFLIISKFRIKCESRPPKCEREKENGFHDPSSFLLLDKSNSLWH